MPIQNPFEEISERLSRIEHSLLDLQAAHSSIPPEVDKLKNIKEAAEFLHLSVYTIYSKVSRGELPSMKKGKRLYFSTQDLTDYVKSGKKLTLTDIEAKAEQYLKNKRN